MSPDDVTRSERIEEQLEAVRQARRREQALFRAPVARPAGYPTKELRRLCLEAREEFSQRR